MIWVKAACVFAIGAAAVHSVLQVAPDAAERRSMGAALTADWRPPKPLTLLVLVITAGFAVAQWLHPALLATLERRPGGPPWQYLTQLVVQSPLWQTPVNLLALAVIGATTERVLGRWRWVLCYLVGAAAGETAGVFWQPYGAGNSIAVLGLLGALIAGLLGRSKTGQGHAWRLLAVLAGGVLLALRDIHGAALLGGLAAGFLLRKDGTAPAEPAGAVTA